jgi:outer membrane receptor protein involved in Fe transport
MQVSNSPNAHRSFSRSPIAAGVVLALSSPALLAQQAQQSLSIDEVVVTAQKRTENLQDVPISIVALGGQALREQNLVNFMDYTKMLPSVAMEMNGTAGAGTGFSLVYMRGISTGGDGQATTSQPSVGMYLDELPITTIQGNLDVHLYDIARVEALAGPQGTLYGASSQSGTIRIITNKPDLGTFDSSVSVQGEMVDGDDQGMTVEGFVNVPIGDKAAVRLVGWSRHDAGWIDNNLGSRNFPGVAATPDDDIIVTNTDKAKDNYNTIDTLGARAALRVDLNDNWTISPTVMFQSAASSGSWGDDLNNVDAKGKYAVSHALPEFVNDDWSMLGLTIEGKIGNFDVVYSGSYMDRAVEGSFDYADYSYWYDAIYTTGYYSDLHFADTGPRAVPNQFVPDYFDVDDVGTRVMNGTRYTNDDKYTKKSHELRISTDPEKSVRGMLGFFTSHQFHDFEQHWEVAGLGTVMLMNEGLDARFADTVYLNSLYRNDRDDAVFGSVDFDIADNLVLTLGARFFEPEVTVKGFFGFGLGFTPIWSSNGEARCNLVEGDDGWTSDFNGQADWKDKPCLNVDKGIKESESVYRANLSWDVNDDSMVYFTWSEGYRPGGINRAPSAGEYVSDFLTNFEFGWKTQWANDRFQFNGAVFLEQWDDFQVSFTGLNAITAVNNGPSADVQGIEAQMVWLPSENLRITGSAAYYSSELKDDYCDQDEFGVCTNILAPKGTGLPGTADFKGNLRVRYSFERGAYDAYWQFAASYNGSHAGALELDIADVLGDVPSNMIVDVATGIRKESWSLDLFVSNLLGEDNPLYRTAECAISTCGPQVYGVRVKPTTVTLRLTKDFN